MPQFLNNIIAATPAAADNSTKVATTAYVKNQGYLPSTLFARLHACGRLTVTSGDPIGAGGTSSSATLYYTPYAGNVVGLYDGSSSWNAIAFSEVSFTAPLTSLPFDVFAYNNSGSLAIETVNWASATGRATALATQDGIYVKSGAPTRRYLGTALAVGGTTIYDTPQKRLVWNYYNRLQKRFSIVDSGAASYTLSGTPSATRYVNNNANNSFKFVVGVKESMALVFANSIVGIPGAGCYGSSFIGYDGLNPLTDAAQQSGNTTINCGTFSGVVHQSDIGYHSYDWIEGVYSPSPITFYLYQPNTSAATGMFGLFWC